MTVVPDLVVENDGPLNLHLEQALLRLSPSEREGRLLTLDDLPVCETAPRAGTTVGALKVHAHRAYRALWRLR